ncbi:MAG: hypothetical protein ACK42L_01440 [Thermoanaerobaculum sp.]
MMVTSEYTGAKGWVPGEGLMKKSLFLLCFSVWARLAPAQVPFQEHVSVSAVSTVIRWGDRTAAGSPRPEQLEVLFNGREVLVLAVEPILPQVPTSVGLPPTVTSKPLPPTTTLPAQERRGVLVLLVRDLCSPRNRDAAVTKLRAYTEELTRVGPVLVAVSPSSGEGAKLCEDSQCLQKELEALSKVSVANWQVKLREEAQSFGSAGLNAELVSVLSGAEEIARVRGALKALRHSLMRYAAEKRLVFLVWDGFDLNLQGRFGPPGQFNRSSGSDQIKTESLAPVGLSDGSYRGELQELAAVMANVGVPVVSLNPGYMAAYSPAWSAQFRRPAVSPEVFGRGSVVADELLVVAAHEPMEYLAEETGGTVIPPRESLAEGLKRLANTFLLWFQVPMAPDGKTYDLEVRVKEPGVKLWAPKRVTLGSSGGQAIARAREAVARGYLAEGELAPEVSLEVQKLEGKSRVGRLEVRTDLGAVREVLEKTTRARLRVTVGVHMKRGEPFVHQEEFEQVVGEQSAGTVWTYEAPIKLPKEAERLAVVIEELQTGAWGAAVVDLLGQGKP